MRSIAARYSSIGSMFANPELSGSILTLVILRVEKEGIVAV